MSIIRPTQRFPLDGSGGDAILWLSIIFGTEGWKHDANTRTRINWLPAGADFKLWGYEAIAAFFRIPQLRALYLFDRSSYPQAQWQNKTTIVEAVRDFAVNEATAPHRREKRTAGNSSGLHSVPSAGSVPRKPRRVGAQTPLSVF